MLSTLQYSATVKFNEYANDTDTLLKSSFKLMKLIKKSHEQYANDTDTLLKSFKLMKLIETLTGRLSKVLIRINKRIARHQHKKIQLTIYFPTLNETCMKIYKVFSLQRYWRIVIGFT